jgi:hypothetical protein
MIFGGVLGFFIAMMLLKPDGNAEKSNISFLEYIIFLAAFYVLLYLATIIHEAGHLVMGLLTGYKYLSFRVGSIVLQKTEQGLKFKKYSIAGTGGQCLMVPPDMENPEDVPYFWYNFGGGLFNLLTAVLCVPFMFADNSIVRLIFILAAVLSVYLGLTNLIPLDLGVTNDGMNILLMAKNPYARGVLYKQFKINALQTNGGRLKDMPEKLFEYDENQKDKLSATMPALSAARLMDEMKFVEAEKLFETIKRELSVDDMNWVSIAPTSEPIACTVKVRSTSEPKKGAMLIGSRCVFPDGIAGVAPGQSAVFYDEKAERVLAGGIIVKQ